MKKKLPETVGLICKSCADGLRSHKLTPEEVAMIEPGCNVKVACCEEGFWVKVTEVKGNTIRGMVNNDIVLCTHYKDDDLVELEVSEVYQVLPKK